LSAAFMAPVDSGAALGPDLALSDVRQLVEAVSPAILLDYEGEGAADNPRGRFLAARRDIKAGETFLSEFPLFCGGDAGDRSRKAYVEDFVALLDAEEEEDALDEDALHPRSPLTDCLAGVVRAKWDALRSEDKSDRAEAALRIRKLSCLWRVGEPDLVQKDCARDVLGVLRPELREITSEEEIHRFMVALCSNRFGGADSKLDLMFAGSMFEHSCLPNCFVGTWRGTPPHQARSYRALRDISAGEALSIDYLHLPDAYLPASGRAELLARWGFACRCARCTSLPELSRCFVCPACGAGELCPRRPGVGAVLECRTCGAAADDAYAERCLAQEAAVVGVDRGLSEEGDQSSSGRSDQGELLGRLHYAAFAEAWLRMEDGPAAAGSVAAFRAHVQLLVDGIRRLHGDPRHPHLLDFYHMLAQLALDNLDEQLRFLDLERDVLRNFYPEDSTRLDEEIMHLCQGRGPFAPSTPGDGGTHEDLSAVDFGSWTTPGLEAMD